MNQSNHKSHGILDTMIDTERNISYILEIYLYSLKPIQFLIVGYQLNIGVWREHTECRTTDFSPALSIWFML